MHACTMRMHEEHLGACGTQNSLVGPHADTTQHEGDNHRGSCLGERDLKEPASLGKHGRHLGCVLGACKRASHSVC